MTPPDRNAPTRFAALAQLPVFLDLAGRRVVVAGGGEPVAWKAELAGRRRRAGHGFRRSALRRSLCARRAGGTVDRRSTRAPGARERSRRRHGSPSPRPRARRGRPLCRGGARRAAPSSTSSTSRPSATSSSAPSSTARRSWSAISTDGAAPILGQAIRRRIEAILPASLGAWARAAQSLPRAARRPPALEGGAPRLLGKLRRRGLHLAGEGGRAVAASSSGSRTTSASEEPARPPGRGRDRRRRARRSGASDPEGRARIAGRRRHPLRPPRYGRRARARPPRGAAHPRRQGGPRRRLPAGGHQRASGRAGAGGPARRAAEGRRSGGLRARRRGGFELAARPAFPCASCRA